MSDDKSIKGSVIIPLLRAAVTGLLFALFGAAFFVGSIPWRVFWLVMSAVALVSWLAVILPNKKIVTGLSQSKVYPTETTRIQITANDPSGAFSAGRWADLPVSIDTIVSVAKRLDAGSSFSHAGLAGPGRPLTRSQYETLRDEFIARGLAYWRDPGSHAQGVALTRAGVAVLKHFETRFKISDAAIPQLQEKIPIRCISPRAAHAHRNTRGNGREALLRD